jgi:hypothetical protein
LKTHEKFLPEKGPLKKKIISWEGKELLEIRLRFGIIRKPPPPLTGEGGAG